MGNDDRDTASRHARSNRGYRILFGSVLTVAVSLVTVLVVELSARFLYEPMTNKIGRFAVSYLESETMPPYASLPKESLPRVLSHPYLLYENTPHWSNEHGAQHDRFGYRQRSEMAESAAGVTRILALGGSTTYGWGVEKPEQAWPRMLERLLRKEGHKVEVINAGLPYATSAELLSSYVFRHRYLRAEIVIVHTGGNDMAAMLFPGYDPEYTHFRASAGSAARPNEKTWLQHSHVLRLLYARWLAMFNIGTYVDQPAPFSEIDPRAALRRVRAIEPIGFTRNIEALIRSVKADGAQVVLVGFVQAREEALSKNRQEFIGFEEAMRVGVEKTLAALKALGKSEGVLYIDLRTEDFEEEWFVDNCHLNEAGQSRKADLIARRIYQVLPGPSASPQSRP